MSGIVVWALFTGGITGAVWAGTILVGHLRKLAKQQLFLLEQLEDRLEQLDKVEKRLAATEERLDFAERLLTSAERRSLPGAGAGEQA